MQITDVRINDSRMRSFPRLTPFWKLRDYTDFELIRVVIFTKRNIGYARLFLIRETRINYISRGT